MIPITDLDKWWRWTKIERLNICKIIHIETIANTIWIDMSNNRGLKLEEFHSEFREATPDEIRQALGAKNA